MGNSARLFFVIVFLAAAASRAASAEPKRIVVLDLGGAGVAADLARALSDVLVTAIRDESAGRVTVIGQADVGAMLSLERQKDLLGCNDSSSCLSEIGGALGADHLVAGSLGKVGTVFLVTLRFIDTRNAEVVRHVSDRVEGRDELLIEAVSQLAHNLVNPARPVGQGLLRVRDAGALTIDGVVVASPVDRLPLAQGTHVVAALDGQGKAVWQQQVEIARYELTTVTGSAKATLAPPQPASPVVEKAWYGRWWVWTAVGAVALGGGAAYVATRADSTPRSGKVVIQIAP